MIQNRYKSPFRIAREMEPVEGVRVFLLPVFDNRPYIDPSIIPEKQLLEINRYQRTHDRDKRLIARSFLYHYLKTVHRITQFDTQPGAYKKPFLPEAAHVHFSISYSADFILIGISTTLPLGVDIEYINDEIPVTEIAPTIMSTGELDHFRQLPEGSAEQYRFFYSVFSKKEAIIKAFGTGLYYDILSINTLSDNTFLYQGQSYVCTPIFTEERSCCINLCTQQFAKPDS
ncbi:MAG: 4'-phosphopantetheinyl transferase superfamily protein [Bacteroidetes bacterium]|nr:4'-phosphopantetheinyl transferase superfamily protein [Bacteroidota bacterium]